MKKTIITLSLAILTSLGITATAAPTSLPRPGADSQPTSVCRPGTPDCKPNPDCRPAPTCRPNPACKPAPDCKPCPEFGHKGDFRKHHKGNRPNPFAGMALSPEQKRKLDALHSDRRSKADQFKADKKKFDKKQRDKRAKAYADYDKKLKKILTPEQYAQYKENLNS